METDDRKPRGSRAKRLELLQSLSTNQALTEANLNLELRQIKSIMLSQISLYQDLCSYLWGIWVAQLVKHLILGFGSSHDLTVCEIEPLVRLVMTTRSLIGILSHSLSH